MKESLSRTIASLGAESVLANHLEYNRSVGNATQVLKEVDELRNELRARLELVVDYLDVRALRSRDLPKSLRVAADRLTIRADRINSTNDWSGLLAALNEVWTAQGSVDTVLAEKAIASVRTQAKEGLDASRHVQVVAKTADKRLLRVENVLVEVSRARSDSKVALKETSEAKAKAREELKETGKSATAAATAARHAKQHWETARTKATESRNSADTAAKAERESEKIKERLSKLESSERERIAKQEEARKTALESLEKADKDATEILFGATIAGLAQFWQQRREKAQNMMWGIGVLLFVFTGVALFVVLLILSPAFSQKVLSVELVSPGISQIWAKLIAAPPLVFALWFLASQFAHARRQAEEYGAKETVAMTLRPYQKFLTDFAGDDAKRSEKVFDILTTAIETLYVRTLSNETVKEDSVLSLSKRHGIPVAELLDFVEKVIKIASPLKGS